MSRPAICRIVIYTDTKGIEKPAVMRGGLTAEGTVALTDLGPIGLTASQFVEAKEGTGPGTWRWPERT